MSLSRLFVFSRPLRDVGVSVVAVREVLFLDLVESEFVTVVRVQSSFTRCWSCRGCSQRQLCREHEAVTDWR